MIPRTRKMRAKAVALTRVVPKLHFLVTDQITRSKFRRPFTWSISARDSLVDVGCLQTVSSSKLAVIGLSDRLIFKIKRLDVIVKRGRVGGILQDVGVACTVLVSAWPMQDFVLSSCLFLPTEDCHVCFQDLVTSHLTTSIGRICRCCVCATHANVALQPVSIAVNVLNKQVVRIFLSWFKQGGAVSNWFLGNAKVKSFCLSKLRWNPWASLVHGHDGILGYKQGASTIYVNLIISV